MVTFVTWLWQGWRPVYNAGHVNRLHRMLQQHMTGDWRLVCITDDDRGIECETFPLWTMPRAKIPGRTDVGKTVVPDCFTRLRLFDPKIGRLFGDVLVSIDLDCTILADLAPLFIEHSYDFVASQGYRSHLCGSMWQLRPGAHREVWDTYDPVESPKRISQTTHIDRFGREWPLSGSDQAWMSLCMPEAPLWTEAMGVHQFIELKPQDKVPVDARVIFFAGKTKPWSRDCQMICPGAYLP